MSNDRKSRRAPSKVTPARKAALYLVSQVRERNIFLSALSSHLDDVEGFNASERAFAYLLARGTLSLQFTLDKMIDRVLSSPQDIRSDVRDALRISAYEILYLHKQDHAAVDQGVELVRSVAPRASGVANFVLRRIAQVKQSFPFGDPDVDLEAAQLYYGFSDQLADAIAQIYSEKKAISFMASSLDAAPIWFSANALRISSVQLARLLEEVGIGFATCHSLLEVNHSYMKGSIDTEYDGETIFRLTERSDVSSRSFARALAQSEIVVSDLSAQSIVQDAIGLLKNGSHMLEIGAGRGTKTLLFQSGLAKRGIKLASYHVMDVSAKKIAGLEERIEIGGGHLDAALVHDATKEYPTHDLYDLVFIDAPCTGLGTLRRHPELKARISPGDSASLAQIGLSILKQASSHIAQDGYLMYATCTILPRENEYVIDNFLALPEGDAFEVVPLSSEGAPFFKTSFESHGPDLHFAALLHKRAS